MLSGRRLDLLDPSPLDVEVEDIAHGLARVARWNGQTHGDHAFSVAQHSLLVERIFGVQEAAASPPERLATLLHDAPEYVIGDMISPFKAVLDGAYRAVEARLLAAIHVRFGLPSALPDALRRRIKQADHVAAYWESVRLAGFSEAEAIRFFGDPAHIAIPDLPDLLQPWPAREAESRYLQTFRAVAGATARSDGRMPDSKESITRS
jgi:hypothetical protein